MNHEALHAAWMKRRNPELKPMFNSALVMKKNEAGDFEFHRKEHTYHRNPQGFYSGKTVEEKLWATVTQDDVVTFHYVNGNADNQAKNLIFKLTGLTVYSDTGHFKNHTYQLRVSLRRSSREERVTYPFAAGFKYDMKNHSILWMPQDAKRVTNRETTKPIIKYVQDVMKVMGVMHRIGAFEVAPNAQREPWSDRRKKLETTDVYDMTEATMGLLAELAYTEAAGVTNKVQTREYGGYDGPSQTTKWIERTQAEADALYWDKLKKTAASRLRDYLKKKNGGFDTVAV